MSDNSQSQEVNSSTIVNHILKFILTHKFGLLIVVILSTVYTFYMSYNYQPLYISTAILDTKGIIQRDVMKEMAHDYFKSSKHSTINKHLIRTDTIKDGTRFYLDIYSNTTDYSSIEKELLNYIVKSEVVLLGLENERNISSLLLDELNKQLKSDSSKKDNSTNNGKNHRIETLKEIEIQKQRLLLANSYSPIEKGFGIAEEIEKIRSVSTKNFIKAFFSGIILLFVFSYCRKKLAG